MGKIKNNQTGFSAVEVLLALIFVAIVAFIGVYIAHTNSNKTTTNTAKTTASSSKQVTMGSQTPKLYTTQEAATFVQTTYNSYLSAINNVSANNTQALGLVGLAAVKNNLTSNFYAQAAASQNGSLFSCAAQFLPSGYTVGTASSNGTNATIPLTISNSDDGSTNTTGMAVTVNLSSLKISAVTCPSN